MPRRDDTPYDDIRNPTLADVRKGLWELNRAFGLNEPDDQEQPPPDDDARGETQENTPDDPTP